MGGWFSILFWLGVVFLGISNCFFSSALALGGKMTPIIFPQNSVPWRVYEPKVVVAFGLIQESLLNRYSKLVKTDLQAQLREIFDGIAVEVLPKAKGQEVVEALMDPNTIGFIFISHSYKTENTRSTVLVGADGHDLPHNILSAATPALRFISFLGCHGPTLRKQYEVDFQSQMITGLTVYYQSDDSILSTRLSLIDNVKRILKKEARDLRTRLSSTDLVDGREPDHSQDGRLIVRVKDVYPAMEPRFVQVNQQIIGVLGGDVEHSNTVWDTENGTIRGETSYKDLEFRVPSSAFKDFDFDDSDQLIRIDPPCHDVRMVPSEMSPGRLVDNYLIESAILKGPFGERIKIYDPPLHIGDQDSPSSEREPPAKPVLRGSKRRKWRQLGEYLVAYFKYAEWIDRDPEVWRRSPLSVPAQKSRFYSDCF